MSWHALRVARLLLHLTTVGIVLTALAAAAAPALAASEVPYGDLVDRAAAALIRNDLAGALDLSERALRADPQGAEALILLGRIHLELGRQEEAVAALRRAAALRPAVTPAGVEARLRLADALVADGRNNEEAIGILGDLLEVAPGRSGLHLALGQIHLALGRLEPARDAFLREIAAQEAGPREAAALAAAYEGLGVASYRRGEDESAIAAIARAGRTPEARYHLGLALARRGRHEEAASALREALALDPEHRGALQALARAAGALGREEERRSSLERFERLYRRAEELNARKVRVGDLRERAQRSAGADDAAGAAAALEEAARLAPDDAALHADLGRALYRAGEAARAGEVFRRVLAARPLSADAHFGLGRILADRGDLPGALASFQSAARLSPLALPYRTALGQIHLRMGRPDEALGELRFARRLDPSSPEAAFNLGLALAQAGALEEAAAEMEKAVALGYAQPQIHQVLAQVYERMGDAERGARERDLFRRKGGDSRGPRGPR